MDREKETEPTCDRKRYKKYWNRMVTRTGVGPQAMESQGKEGQPSLSKDSNPPEAKCETKEESVWMVRSPEGHEKRAKIAEARPACLAVRGRPVSETLEEMAQLETQEAPAE